MTTDNEARQGRVIRERVEYWIEEEAAFGWIDYAHKESLAICEERIRHLKTEHPKRTFRPIARVITDKDMSQ